LAGSWVLAHEGPIVYVCAEKRAEVVKERAKRLIIQTKNILCLKEFLAGRVLQAAEGTVELVVDSLPAITTRAFFPGRAAARREAPWSSCALPVKAASLFSSCSRWPRRAWLARAS
ncbi:MAG: hypothetical protein QW707_07000, partial [Candidatus Bathyarchaeia archaeon]